MPIGHFEYQGQQVDMTAENTSLWHYLPERKTIINGVEYDNTRFAHIWVIIHELGNEAVEGTHVWRDDDPETFDAAAESMANGGYLVHLNLREVGEVDQLAFIRHQESIIKQFEIPDELPDDFN